MSRWLRLYDDLVDDPKVQRLPGDLFKALINLWCITSQNDGALPPTADIAFKLRISVAKVEATIAGLRNAGLIDDDGNGNLAPHNWNGRQFKSDVSTERVQRFRKRPRNVSSTVSETPPETPPDTEQNRTESETDAADAAPTSDLLSSNSPSPPARAAKSYAFESGIIRLSQKDFDKWKRAYSHLDLEAELLSMTRWAAEQGPENWFFAVSGALAKRNRELGLRLEQNKSDGLTNDERYFGVGRLPGVV